MKTTKSTIESTHQYNKAYDLVAETLARMTFVLESAPFNYTDQNFTKEGLSGMSWLVGDLVVKLQKAENILKGLAHEREANT